MESLLSQFSSLQIGPESQQNQCVTPQSTASTPVKELDLVNLDNKIEKQSALRTSPSVQEFFKSRLEYEKAFRSLSFGHYQKYYQQELEEAKLAVRKSLYNSAMKNLIDSRKKEYEILKIASKKSAKKEKIEDKRKKKTSRDETIRKTHFNNTCPLTANTYNSHTYPNPESLKEKYTLYDIPDQKDTFELVDNKYLLSYDGLTINFPNEHKYKQYLKLFFRHRNFINHPSRKKPEFTTEFIVFLQELIREERARLHYLTMD
ncbi:uncharacterized protein RJT20DRAFT_154913 [Scheffersomyces xylosifermentans]|uniref:uncharacterized protein n=1 Tax=Scheffersomyces xylosifermentans TaxID=1304137 RepID=UPI00315D9F59